MALSRDKLIMMALVVLHDAIDRTEAGPLGTDHAVRLALAVLFRMGAGTRWKYDGFWKAMNLPDDLRVVGDMRSYGRTNATRSALRGIISDVGLPDTAETDQVIRRARAGKAASPNTPI